MEGETGDEAMPTSFTTQAPTQTKYKQPILPHKKETNKREVPELTSCDSDLYNSHVLGNHGNDQVHKL